MVRKDYEDKQWVTENQLREVVPLTVRQLRNLRRKKKIPFKRVSTKTCLYVIQDVLDAFPSEGGVS